MRDVHIPANTYYETKPTNEAYILTNRLTQPEGTIMHFTSLPEVRRRLPSHEQTKNLHGCCPWTGNSQLERKSLAVQPSLTLTTRVDIPLFSVQHPCFILSNSQNKYYRFFNETCYQERQVFTFTIEKKAESQCWSFLALLLAKSLLLRFNVMVQRSIIIFYNPPCVLIRPWRLTF